MSLSHLLLVPFSSNLICQNFDGDYRHRTSEGRRPLLLSLRYNNHLFCHTKPKDFLTPTVKKTHTFSRREGILHKPIHHLKTAVKLSLLNVYSIFRIENSAAASHQQNKVVKENGLELHRLGAVLWFWSCALNKILNHEKQHCKKFFRQSLGNV